MNPISSPSSSAQQLGNHPLLRPQPQSRPTTETFNIKTQGLHNTSEATTITRPQAIRPEAPPVIESLSTPTTPPAKTTRNSQLPDFLARKVQDIQNVASQVGYVDLSEGAIVSAMRENRSLLADYRA